MEFRFRGSDEREPPILPYTPLRSRLPLPPPPPARIPSPDFLADPPLRGDYLRSDGPMGPKDSLAELKRELQEERIKEEILASRLSQRRMLEEQARSEMEMERAITREILRVDRFQGPLMMMPPEHRFNPRLAREKDGFNHELPFRDSPDVVRARELPFARRSSELSRINEVIS